MLCRGVSSGSSNAAKVGFLGVTGRRCCLVAEARIVPPTLSPAFANDAPSPPCSRHPTFFFGLPCGVYTSPSLSPARGRKLEAEAEVGTVLAPSSLIISPVLASPELIPKLSVLLAVSYPLETETPSSAAPATSLPVPPLPSPLFFRKLTTRFFRFLGLGLACPPAPLLSV